MSNLSSKRTNDERKQSQKEFSSITYPNDANDHAANQTHIYTNLLAIIIIINSYGGSFIIIIIKYKYPFLFISLLYNTPLRVYLPQFFILFYYRFFPLMKMDVCFVLVMLFFVWLGLFPSLSSLSTTHLLHFFVSPFGWGKRVYIFFCFT